MLSAISILLASGFIALTIYQIAHLVLFVSNYHLATKYPYFANAYLENISIDRIFASALDTIRLTVNSACRNLMTKNVNKQLSANEIGTLKQIMRKSGNDDQYHVYWKKLTNSMLHNCEIVSNIADYIWSQFLLIIVLLLVSSVNIYATLQFITNPFTDSTFGLFICLPLIASSLTILVYYISTADETNLSDRLERIVLRQGTCYSNLNYPNSTSNYDNNQFLYQLHRVYANVPRFFEGYDESHLNLSRHNQTQARILYDELSKMRNLYELWQKIASYFVIINYNDPDAMQLTDEHYSKLVFALEKSNLTKENLVKLSDQLCNFSMDCHRFQTNHKSNDDYWNYAIAYSRLINQLLLKQIKSALALVQSYDADKIKQRHLIEHFLKLQKYFD